MRIVTLALAALVLVAATWGAPASAETLTQPASVKQVTYFDDTDVADLKATETPAAIETSNAYRQAACCPEMCDPGCSPCNSLGFTTGGWLQAGITANSQDPQDRFNGPLMTDDRVGELEMNELWFYLERPIHTENGFDVGGRVDFLYGTDWRIVDCYGNGLEDRMNGPRNLYGVALPQMYVEAGVGDFSVKMGRMTGILGYEVVPPMYNFFYSHSYSLCYSEPILITGLMSTYKVSDQVSLLAGFHNGYHQFENDNGDVNFQGGVKWTSRSGWTSLAYCLDAGRNDIHALSDQYVQSVVWQQKLSCRWQYVFQSDYGFTNGVAGDGDADWYSVNQYLFYTINTKWSAGMRVEWFNDDDGTRVFGVGNLPDARGWMGAPGYAGSFTELTAGLNWKPRANVTFRPEMRWDWYNGDQNPNGPYPYPFDDGTRTSQLTAACDLIIVF